MTNTHNGHKVEDRTGQAPNRQQRKILMDTIEMMAVLPATDFWAFCAEQWTEIARAAHTSGDQETEGFFREMSVNADYISEQLGHSTI